MKSSRSYIREQVIVNSLVNFLIALLLGWVSLNGQEKIPMWAPSHSRFDVNMGGNILLGTFLLGVILSLIITAVTKRNLRRNQVKAQSATGLIAHLPKAGFKRSLLMGLVAMLTIGIANVALLTLLEIDQLHVWDFILYHSVYMAVLAGIISVPATKSALVQDS